MDLVLSNSAIYGLISQTDFFEKDIANKENTNKYYVIHKGDFVYNPRKSMYAPYGPINILEQYDVGIVSPLYNCFKIEDKYSMFLKWYFKSTKWHRYVYIHGDQGARGDRVSIKDEIFFNMPIYIPNELERNKIITLLNIFSRKIELLEAKISILKKYKEGIMFRAFIEAQCRTFKLEELTSNNTITLGRGNIIPKQKGIYPVYSSSAQNNGLFCYKNDYMFDEELVTWSVDGGGRPFIRKKHKFSITNVCGFAKINNNNIVNYWWLYICFWNNWKSINFDYTTKAHPSVIDQLYKIKLPTIDYQIKYSTILDKIESILKINNECLFALNKLKKQLMKDLFL